MLFLLKAITDSLGCWKSSFMIQLRSASNEHLNDNMYVNFVVPLQSYEYVGSFL